MTKEDEFQNNHLEHVFDMNLQYSEKAVECAPIGLTEGRIIGSGDGFVEGPDIKGTIRWSNYENTVREGLCKLQIPGTIKTSDGEEMLFEARGIAAILDKSQSSCCWCFSFRYGQQEVQMAKHRSGSIRRRI